MRLKLAYVPFTAFVILLAIGAIPVDASIRPSFDLDSCSWNATHIVLVETTVRDGVFSVVESLKGDLKPADSLEIPELKPTDDAVPISSYPKPQGFFQDPKGISEQIPRQPVGSRMILFLKRRAKKDAALSPAGKPTGIQWDPASAFGGMRVSAVWIDAGKAYCFRQWQNPGPSTLSECGQISTVASSDVAVLTSRIQAVLRVQRDLAETVAMNNAEVRVERLGRVALGDVYQAQQEAMDALGKSGSVALPEVFQIMDKSPAFYDEKELIQMLVEAAGKDSGSQLHARLQQDLIYWKAVGPTLTQDWLDQLMTVGSPLFMKFNETKLLVRELDKEHYAAAAPTVAELRDFGVSQPQLYDPKWGERDLRNGGTALEISRAESYELAKECDDFVKHVRVETIAR
jgi:hypothetical protein